MDLSSPSSPDFLGDLAGEDGLNLEAELRHRELRREYTRQLTEAEQQRRVRQFHEEEISLAAAEKEAQARNIVRIRAQQEAERQRLQSVYASLKQSMPQGLAPFPIPEEDSLAFLPASLGGSGEEGDGGRTDGFASSSAFPDWDGASLAAGDPRNSSSSSSSSSDSFPSTHPSSAQEQRRTAGGGAGGGILRRSGVDHQPFTFAGSIPFSLSLRPATGRPRVLRELSHELELQFQQQQQQQESHDQDFRDGNASVYSNNGSHHPHRHPGIQFGGGGGQSFSSSSSNLTNRASAGRRPFPSAPASLTRPTLSASSVQAQIGLERTQVCSVVLLRPFLIPTLPIHAFIVLCLRPSILHVHLFLLHHL